MATPSTSTATSDGSRALERGDDPCDIAIVAASDHVDRLLVSQGRNRLHHPDGNEVGLDDPGEAVADRRQRGEALGARPGGGGGQREPCPGGARPRTRRAGDVLVAESSFVADANRLFGKCSAHYAVPLSAACSRIVAELCPQPAPPEKGARVRRGCQYVAPRGVDAP